MRLFTPPNSTRGERKSSITFLCTGPVIGPSASRHHTLRLSFGAAKRRVTYRMAVVQNPLPLSPLRVKTSDGCLFRWSWPPASWRKHLGGVGRNYRKPFGHIGRRRAASRIASCLETTATNVQIRHENRGPPTKS